MSASWTGYQGLRRARRKRRIRSNCCLWRGAYVDARGCSCLLLDLLLRESVALVGGALNRRGHTRRGSWAGGGRAHTCSAASLFWNTRALSQWHVGDERMVDSIVRFEAAVGIPAKTARNKVNEGIVIRLQRLLQCLAAWPTSPTFAADSDSRLANRVEE